MPIPALIGAGIDAGSQLLGNIFTRSNNRQQRRWAEGMYDKQRADSLFDWNMQNEYNSPERQMERLKKAGLNPNLVYGTGATAQSTSQPRASNPGTYHPEPARFSGSSALSSFYTAELQKEQVNNLRAQNTAIVEDTMLKRAQRLAIDPKTENIKADTDMKRFKLEFGTQLSSHQLDKLKAEVKKIGADTEFTLASNERAQLQSVSSLREAAVRILEMREKIAKSETERQEIRQRITNLQKDEELKQLDINLKKVGIQPSDNVFARMAAQIVGKMGYQGDPVEFDRLYPGIIKRAGFGELLKKK